MYRKGYLCLSCTYAKVCIRNLFIKTLEGNKPVNRNTIALYVLYVGTYFYNT